MEQKQANEMNMLHEVAARIQELREISGDTVEEMAEKTDVSPEEYLQYESGSIDIPFTFIHKCALCFGVELTDLLEGTSAHLRSYTVTRKGTGQITAKEEGIEIRNLATMFHKKIAEPYWVKYEYSAEQQTKPIHLTTHGGQEFDLILSGQLKVQVGSHTEILSEGDSIYYDSATPHGMIAVGGEDCVFCAVVLPGEENEENQMSETIAAAKQTEHLIYENFVIAEEDENGALQSVGFRDEENFNFAFDVIDRLAEKKPNKLAMIHLDVKKRERRFTFDDIRKGSSRAANYFKAMGIQRGDRVMLVLKRHYQFWFAMLALNKIGAIAIPAPNQLLTKDFEYRFQTAGIKAILCTADGETASYVDEAQKTSPELELKMIVNGKRDGWRCFDEEYMMYSGKFQRQEDSPCGSDPMVMFFTSGTSGYPKIARHTYKYPLGHFITAKYWHRVETHGLHFTISDTGWGKALWGKLYGQWLCEAPIFVYDFNRFDANDILPLFKEYNVTTFCVPPTMYRFMIKEDLSRFDLSSIHHATTAGEALNPEVFHQFKKATGLSVMEGFGQTESTLLIGNLVGMMPKIGSMGKANPLFDVRLLKDDGTQAEVGETGEICVRTAECGESPVGLFSGYFLDEGKTRAAWHDGYYHTGDTAWQDEDGYYWYVGRVDDVIKSSGYRIGPFEIESVIMELPYVLECGVSAAPDEIRGQVVKASIVLVKGKEGSEELKKEVQNYVKKRTAPYKYPRIVVFRDSLPKTNSGKIQRNLL